MTVDDVHVEVKVDIHRGPLLQRGAQLVGIGGDAFDTAGRKRVILGGIEIPRIDQQALLVRDRPQPDWLADELGNATGRGRQGHPGEITAA